jgi:DNA-binding PadR family transcriptional regulator
MIILTDALVLSVFTPGKAKSGLEVHADLERVTGSTIKLGSVQPKLRSLESEGLLKSWDEYSDHERVRARRGRPVRMYELTASGLRRKTQGTETQGNFGTDTIPEPS